MDQRLDYLFATYSAALVGRDYPEWTYRLTELENLRSTTRDLLDAIRAALEARVDRPVLLGALDYVLDPEHHVPEREVLKVAADMLRDKAKEVTAMADPEEEYQPPEYSKPPNP
jgi:hypothetical protein